MKRRTPAGIFDLVQVLPGDGRVGFHHRAGQGGFDGEVVLGGLVVVQATDTAIGRQAGIGGNAGAGDEEQPVGAAQFFRDAGDEGGIGIGHGAAFAGMVRGLVKILMLSDVIFSARERRVCFHPKFRPVRLEKNQHNQRL
ncbi:MAG: hypothetical protein MZV65_13635 [Chromatiales bacterium]|nr:hypothetical protein [Chromatiales bacterium]